MLGCCFGDCETSGRGALAERSWQQHPALLKYKPIAKLGEGGFSEVHLADNLATGKQVALKVVFLGRRDLTPPQRRVLRDEAKYLQMVNHPNVVKCIEVVDIPRPAPILVMVMEALVGGEVLPYLASLEAYSEAVAVQVFHQVASAVAYLHGLGLMHRDIKPENAVLAKPAAYYAAKGGRPPKVKLIDLGMAGIYRPRQPQRGCMGSPGFIAPEVVRGAPHTPAMDIYSCGVLLFVLLVGRKPWDEQDIASLQYALRRSEDAPGLRDRRFAALSKDAKHLLRWMLSDLAQDRPTAAEVLGHPWLQCDPSAACCRRRLGRAVQRRMAALADSRRLLRAQRNALQMAPLGRVSRSNAPTATKQLQELETPQPPVQQPVSAHQQQAEEGGKQPQQPCQETEVGQQQRRQEQQGKMQQRQPPQAETNEQQQYAKAALQPPQEQEPQKPQPRLARTSALSAALARPASVVTAGGTSSAVEASTTSQPAATPWSPTHPSTLQVLKEWCVSVPTNRTGTMWNGGRYMFRPREAVSCSPGALELLEAAAQAQQADLLHARLTTDDDSAPFATSRQPAAAPSLGALGIRALWSPRAAARELLASFRRMASSRRYHLEHLIGDEAGSSAVSPSTASSRRAAGASLAFAAADVSPAITGGAMSPGPSIDLGAGRASSQEPPPTLIGLCDPQFSFELTTECEMSGDFQAQSRNHQQQQAPAPPVPAQQQLQQAPAPAQQQPLQGGSRQQPLQQTQRPPASLSQRQPIQQAGPEYRQHVQPQQPQLRQQQQQQQQHQVQEASRTLLVQAPQPAPRLLVPPQRYPAAAAAPAPLDDEEDALPSSLAWAPP